MAKAMMGGKGGSKGQPGFGKKQAGFSASVGKKSKGSFGKKSMTGAIKG